MPFRSYLKSASPVVCSCLVYLLSPELAGAAQQLPVLRKVSQIRKLTRDEANRGFPVHLTGVVTFVYAANITDKTIPAPLLANMFIQDSTGGNWVKLTHPAPDLHAGDKIELTGKTVQDDFAPDIADPHWRILGHAPFPKPVRAEFGLLASTQEDSLWVEIDGIVRAAKIVSHSLQLQIRMNGGQVTAYVPAMDTAVPDHLLNAHIRVQGVCGSDFNAKNQLRGVYLFVPSLAQMKMLEPGLEDPFKAPQRSVASTLRFTLGGATTHLIRISGAVTLQRNGRFLFLKGSDGDIRVDSDQKLALKPGQTVEAAGFPALGEFGPILEQAHFRITGPIVSLKPKKISTSEVLNDDLAGDLISFKARLLERIVTPLEQGLVVKVDSTIVQARLEDPEAASMISTLEPGTLLQLSGVAEGVSKNNTFLLLLRSHRDIQILSRPPWWNLRHAVWTFGLMAILIAAAVSWLAILRRKIRDQTAVIKKRLESETALEQRYRQLFERNLAGVFTLNARGQMLDCNDACVKIFGLSDKQDLLAPGSPGVLALHQALTGKLESGQTASCSELNLRRSDGEECWLLLNTNLVETEAGCVNEGTIIDITELKRTVRTLEERTTFLSELVRNNPLAIAVLDPGTKVVACNGALERMFLYTEKEFVGQRLPPMIGAPIENMRGILAEHSAGRTTFQVCRRIRKDGVWLDVEAHGVPIIVEGKIVGTYVIFQDISARVAADAELRKTKEAAEAASRAKSEFLANMSHEIRTPMNGILLAAELASADNLTVEQRDYLETIRTSGKSLLLIINDVLDLSKIEAGKMELNLADFSIADCLSDCVTLMAGRARQKNLDLTLHVDPRLPARVRGDSLRLRQVILNLLGNALKFTQEGSVSVRVEPQESTGEQLKIRFSVSDTGIGIAPADCSKIFCEFEQADGSSTRNFGGTGLGLAISSKLVALMGGAIDLKSQVGQGSTFSFTSTFNSAISSQAPGDGTRKLSAERRPSDSLRILLAEDNPINRKLARRLLERQGHSIVTAENGREAVQIYGEHSFDVVLMDVHMPEMDGLEATRQIRALQNRGGKFVPIIAVTASAMKEDREACLAAGMDSYISKPISTDELMAALRALTRPQAA